MVNNATALGRNGLHDWLLLRTTAIIVTFYIIYILAMLAITEKITYNTWQALFQLPFTKVFTCLTLLSILVHGWIGMWQVLTDYIKTLAIRMFLQLAVVIILFTYAIYGTIIVWSA
ncbi:succinate dehydrogenase, hydrophobic membrane anchor protein [Candidatus Erwinia haradaeae]|uniref:Succinate dehydrogenase hydrophobic membrane anchor subunit n=1 Tax=Candidatus Erwinia haradaeae TaxID=1922217 RepID=A0A451D503_9GAMM|nr:succinate dehydrogenase, hydrophobic membrane anchor protein [Candidatus Erwinia haradaeae]VFP80760.1 Succinate dehydrogenase hydrophobic membrane anchor subunit [Candidatus Erwinia haradaeae]